MGEIVQIPQNIVSGSNGGAGDSNLPISVVSADSGEPCLLLWIDRNLGFIKLYDGWTNKQHVSLTSYVNRCGKGTFNMICHVG